MSKGVFSVKVTFDDRAIGDKLEAPYSVGTMYDICMAYKKIIEPWVPYDTGNLANDVDFVHDMYGSALVYNADYASKVYYGDDIPFRKDKHPLATAHWDTVAMQTEREHFAREAEKILKDQLKRANDSATT